MSKNAIIFLLGGVIGAVLAIGILRTWKTQGSAITWRTSDTALIVQSPSLGAPRPDPAPYPNVMSWQEISGLDLKSLAPKLREMGCPENLIRDILVAEANRKLAQQLKSLCAKIPNLYSNFLSADGQVQVVFDHLNKARFTCLSEIFGNDITIDDDQIGKPYREVRPDAGLLSDEQVESIVRLESELSKTIEAIFLKSRGFLTASDKAEIEAAKKNRDSEIQKVLTPDEYMAFQINGFVSNPDFKQTYRNFQPSGNEVVAIFQYSERLSHLDEEADRDLAQAQMQDDLAKTMSPERQAEFMKYQDPAYRESIGLLRRFGLADGMADGLMDLKREALQQAVVVTPGTDPSQIEAALSGQMHGMRDRVRSLLGKEAAEAYIADGSTAIWLK